jgi:hypothetical protein
LTGDSMPTDATITLVVSTGSDVETIVLTADLQTFEVNEPYAELLLSELPTTGGNRWTRTQMFGWALAMFGLLLMSTITPTRRRRRR